MSIETVGVVGCGLMGSGIAEVVARSGLRVVVLDQTEDLLQAGEARIRSSLDRGVERGKTTELERDTALASLAFTTETHALDGADLVIEAVVENLEVKRGLFTALDAICPEHTILASNTSSLPIADLAAATSRPDRFVGLHFFNPVPAMKLVEVIRSVTTSEETFERVVDVCERIGKVTVAAKDNPGFVVNLLLVPYLLDAIRQLERGVASVRDIDTAMTLGCGHPMGPLALSDFVGLDTLCRVGDIMYGEYREARYAPPPLLRRLVALGRFGRKSGMGFYDWSGAEPVPTLT